MSHSEDRWQLSWLPLPLKKSVLKSFHDIDRQTSIDLYISLGTVPDHELAAVLGVDSMTVTRLRQAFGIPVLLTSYIPIGPGRCRRRQGGLVFPAPTGGLRTTLTTTNVV